MSLLPQPAVLICNNNNNCIVVTTHLGQISYPYLLSFALTFLVKIAFLKLFLQSDSCSSIVEISHHNLLHYFEFSENSILALIDVLKGERLVPFFPQRERICIS